LILEIVNPLETEKEKRVTVVTSSFDGLLFCAQLDALCQAGLHPGKDCGP